MEKSEIDLLTGKIIGAAIEVHKQLGPGLLESAYEQCLCHELALRDVRFARQLALPVRYKGLLIDIAYRMDLVVEAAVIVELKCGERLLPIHEAQLITYMKLSGIQYGLLLNFNVRLLKSGIKRLTTAPMPEPPK
jgi:GxxExxY protein